MNPLPPNTDELVSAYLDGQAAPNEIILVESSPELMERVRSMRSVADLLGQPLAPPPAQKEAHLSAALDAFDALFSADAVETEPLANEPAAAEPDMPDGVTSLAAARERRRPRRCSPGVIAAAAVVLLFVAVAAFGFGGGNDSLDVASSPAEGDASNAITSAEAAPETMNDDAMSDDDMALDSAAAGSALSDVAPQPTVAAPQAAAAEPMADEEDAMADDEAMDDSEDAAEDTAESVDEGSAESSPAPEIDSFQLFSGDFDDEGELRLQLKQLPIDDFANRVDPRDPGLFDSCQLDVAELADIETSTLVGEAFIAGELVEIHQIVDGDDITFILVDPAAGCSVLPETP